MGFLDALKGLFGGGADYYRKNFGLDPDEQVTQACMAYYDPDVSTGKQVLTSASGLMAGAVVKIAGEQVMIVMTSKGRLAIGLEGGSYSPPRQYGPSPRPVIQDTGRSGDSTMAGPTGKLEKTKVLMVKPPGEAPYRIILAESGAALLLNWSRG
jgi:hypothetical protein